MGNIKIIKGVFDTKLELEHAGIAAGFPSPADEYRHETLDFNRDYIRHPEASFYGDGEGDSTRLRRWASRKVHRIFIQDLLHAFGESHVSADALCSQLGIIAVEADKRGVWESCSHLFEWETDDDGRVETYTKLQ